MKLFRRLLRNIGRLFTEPCPQEREQWSYWEDWAYREKLISAGVRRETVLGVTGRYLNAIGNLVEVYRDGETAETQDPGHAGIMKYHRDRYLQRRKSA